ncbi:MAG: serine hydrolase [Candidatus Aminicenantes bacterium]|nr:serine hydrolase [Candidatus Aminicenantes bacterium]
MGKDRSLLIACSCFLLVILPAVSAAEAAPSLQGHWTGAIELPGQKLEIDCDFILQPDGSWKGDISIPAQNARDLLLTGIAFKDGEAAFAISGIPGEPAFKGRLAADGNEVSGSFAQGGQTFSFRLQRADSPPAQARAALSAFDAVVSLGLKSLNVPGAAVVVVVDDEVVLAKGYGYRDLEKKAPMTADTLLAIGSSSKAFTTFAMGTLVDQGRLEWDVPLRRYIPWFRLTDEAIAARITPRDLVTHRSGLPRHDLTWYNNQSSSREELVRRLEYLEPTADLRERFQYNNMMFLTAGFLVETLTGKSWEDSIRRLVLEPLDMERTNFSVRDSQKDADFAFPYVERKGQLERFRFRDITTVGPAGSINSTANEMGRWLKVHLNGGKLDGRPIIQPQTLQDMHLSHMPTGETPEIPELSPASYGMGWFVDSYRGHGRVHHGGNIDGFSAMVSFFPKERLGFVVLCNLNATALPELLVRQAADLILGLEPKDWIGEAAERKSKGEKLGKEAEQKKFSRRVPKTKPAHDLGAYVGDYNHPGYGDLKVTLQKGRLSFAYNGIVTPLEHWHYETFNGLRAADPTFEDFKLLFRTDLNGRVSALEAQMEATLEAIVFCKKPPARLSDPGFLEKFTGRYSLLDRVFTVTLKGSGLKLVVPGAPELDMIPGLDEEFTLKQAKMIVLRFKTDAKGKVLALELVQPNGIFEAERVLEK